MRSRLLLSAVTLALIGLLGLVRYEIDSADAPEPEDDGVTLFVG